MQTRAKALAWAAAAGIVLGAGYAASPLTIWFAVWIAVVCAWAGRGLSERERRVVLVVVGVAVAIRVIAVAVLFLGSDHSQIVSFFWDGDGVFIKRRALTFLNLWNGVPVHSYDFAQAYDPYGWSTYLYMLAYLQYLVGPAPYAVHLVNVAAFVTAAVALYRLCRPAYGQAAALTALALVLFLPTLISWSVAALKESLYVLLCATCVASVVATLRARTNGRRVAALALLLAATAVTPGLRAGAALITVGGIVFGLIVAFAAKRPRVIPAIVVLAIVAPVALWNTGNVQARIMEQLKTAATVHAGNANTEGHHYKLLDERLYFDASVPTMTPDEALRFVIRGIVSFLIVPLPWQLQSRSELAFLPQQIVWYLLVVFAVPGFITGLRRDPLVTGVLAGVACMAGIVIALNNGNIGTLVRFRDTVVPFFVWLSTLGAIETMATLVARARQPIAPAGRSVSTLQPGLRG
jgi:hypothetical protein